jgi:hypothetical protein
MGERTRDTLQFLHDSKDDKHQIPTTDKDRKYLGEQGQQGNLKNSTVKWAVHCKRRFVILPSSAGMAPTKLSLAGKKSIIPGQGEFG